MDRLPPEVRLQFEGALVRNLEPDELRRAFAVAIEGLLSETRHVEPALAGRLEAPLALLTRPST
jgi:hypothetical protein